MIEHVAPERHGEVLYELKRVAKKAVYLTSTDETAHRGSPYEKAVEVNPFNRYLGVVSRGLLEEFGFRILFEDGHHVKAFLRL